MRIRYTTEVRAQETGPKITVWEWRAYAEVLDVKGNSPYPIADGTAEDQASAAEAALAAVEADQLPRRNAVVAWTPLDDVEVDF